MGSGYSYWTALVAGTLLFHHHMPKDILIIALNVITPSLLLVDRTLLLGLPDLRGQSYILTICH